MLRLDRNATLTLPLLNVPNNPPSTSTLLSAIGWGETKNSNASNKLKIARDLVYMPSKTCNVLWNGHLREDIMLCAGLGQEDTCQGEVCFSLDKKTTLNCRRLWWSIDSPRRWFQWHGRGRTAAGCYCGRYFFRTRRVHRTELAARSVYGRRIVVGMDSQRYQQPGAFFNGYFALGSVSRKLKTIAV